MEAEEGIAGSRGAWLLALALGFQQDASLPAPADPLQRVVALEVGAAGAVIEHVSDFDGALSIWARSEALDPRLYVEVVGGGAPLEDDDSGGGTTAYLTVTVRPGDVVLIAVLGQGEAAGDAELHVVAAPETAETRAAAEMARSELAGIGRLGAESAFEEARERVTSLVERLVSVAGGSTSGILWRPLVDAGLAARAVGALGTEDRAWAAVHSALARLRPPEHMDMIRIQADLARTRAQLGDRARAYALAEAVHATCERVLPPGHQQLLFAKENLAAMSVERGDYAGALALSEEVYAARLRSRPPDDPELRLVKGNHSMMLLLLGDIAGANALAEEVYAACRGLPPEDQDLLWAKERLALTRTELGDLPSALALDEEVYAVRERILPADHPDLLRSKGNLAVGRKAIGDLEGALALDESLHAAFLRLLPRDHPNLLLSMENLALEHERLGDLEGALALLEEDRAVRERSLPADHPNLLHVKGLLASVHAARGDHALALALRQEVLAASERALSPDHGDVLTAKEELASQYGLLGDRARALELDEAVHAAYERLRPSGHPDRIRAASNLAISRFESEDLDGSLELCREVARSLADVLVGAVSVSPREARAIARNAVDRLGRVRFQGVGDAELERASFEVLETARQMANAPLYARLAHLEGEEARAIRVRLRAAEAELDRLVASGPQAPDAHADAGEQSDEAEREESGRIWREAVQTAGLRRDRAQRELLSLVDGETVTRITVDALARALAPDQLAVGITKLASSRWDEETSTSVLGAPHYLAHVVLPGGELRAVDLGPAAALEDAIAAWREALGAPLERGISVASGDMPGEVAAGRALRRMLIDPLLAAAGGAKAGATLHLCPDDALFTVPIDALPLEESTAGAEAEVRTEPLEGDVARLGDRYRVRLELSLARLLRPRTDPEAPPAVLAVGEIDFDAELEGELLASAEPLARLSPWGRWERLSATAAEVQELAFQTKEHLGLEACVLKGSAVTQASLAEAVRGKRFVHVATHGWFLPRSRSKSILDEERGSDSSVLLGARETVTGFAPLTLCGLVLSGANAGETDAERSACLLTAQELADFDLSACELAVLSACETNVGVTRAGQGIQSLQSALHMAGARTSITSLWAVRDWPTQSLMKRFYENLWSKHLGKAEALWQAKRALRAEGEPPFVWAGWVLAGDPD